MCFYNKAIVPPGWLEIQQPVPPRKQSHCPLWPNSKLSWSGFPTPEMETAGANNKWSKPHGEELSLDLRNICKVMTRSYHLCCTQVTPSLRQALNCDALELPPDTETHQNDSAGRLPSSSNCTKLYRTKTAPDGVTGGTELVGC